MVNYVKLRSGKETIMYVLGVGSSNIDIYGKSLSALSPHHDFPGRISAGVGGVTHNILENLARLGDEARLITAVGNDLFGKQILEECEAAGIRTDDSLVVEGASSGVFLQMLDDHNDMFIAMTDLSIEQHLTAEYLRKKEDLLAGASAIVCDPALPVDTLAALTEGRVPVFIDPTSEPLAEKIRDIAGRFYCIKPNRKELAALTGLPLSDVTDYEGILEAGKLLLDKGVHTVCVSLGHEGCLYMDREGHVFRRRLLPAGEMVNASGAGDAFLAALVYGYIHQLDLVRTIDYALAAGLSAVLTPFAVDPALSLKRLEELLRLSGTPGN